MASEPVVRIEVLDHGRGLPLPLRATPGSSGVDLHAAVGEHLDLEPGARASVPTGLRVCIPEGYEWQVRPRSGLALHHGLCVLNSPGTIDSDYRGEICVIVANLGSETVRISRGMRIAQAVLARVPCWSYVVEEDGLPGSERGEGGFGHSGTGPRDDEQV
ncbi:dUTP diphosphatase [Candidatus Fermentibacterales bacterium]|nr:dUTP diphosphatase [Candidatus Fermentibacterales bacterium]